MIGGQPECGRVLGSTHQTRVKHLMMIAVWMTTERVRITA